MCLQVLGLVDEYSLASDSSGRQVCQGVKMNPLPYPLQDRKVWNDAHALAGVPSSKLIFLATDLQNKKQIVEFVQQYGTDTHKAWAEADLVPKLLEEPEAVGGGWQQIQMEYLSTHVSDNSGWVPRSWLMRPRHKQMKHAHEFEHLTLAESSGSFLLDRALALLQTAHATKVNGVPAVHGDARPNNIMVLMEDSKVVKLKFIDMDWAGPEDVARYPVLINMEAIEWPDGVGPAQPMKQEHDRALLSSHVSPATADGLKRWQRMP